MQQSDVSNTSLDRRRVRTIAVVCGVVMSLTVAGLATYIWQLRQQIEDLSAGSEQPALQSLLESAHVAPDSSEQFFNNNPAVPPLSGPSTALPVDPFQHMEEIRRQMDAMMSSIFNSPSPAITGVPGFGSLSGDSLFGADPFASLGMNQLTLNLRETDETLELVIPVQEGQEFELSTDVEEDRLTVSGTLSWQQQSSQNGVGSQRQGSTRFSRTIVLPGNVDPTGLVTEHKENEIVISLPKV